VKRITLAERIFDMNGLIDTDPESYRRADDESSRSDDSRYLKFIELLIDKSIKRLQSKSYRPKIQDALRAIRLKHKVFKVSEAEKIFWQEIEAIRNEELPKLYPETEPLDLESQITETIRELKHHVTNGILPVKTITDTFNQGKSKESQSQDPEFGLTYSRLGRLLSAMGFRKTKTSNGSSAIIWDDQLLLWLTSSHTQDTNSSVHNSLPENCLEEK
jgi:hypothetical protein